MLFRAYIQFNAIPSIYPMNAIPSIYPIHAIIATDKCDIIYLVKNKRRGNRVRLETLVVR